MRILLRSPLREREIAGWLSQEWSPDPPDFFRRRFWPFPDCSRAADCSEAPAPPGASNGGVRSPAAGIFNIRRQLGQTIPLPS
jgi:hypothetical protein